MITNIILIGFMAAGKSSVGKFLAQSLDWDFIDTDWEIEKITGLTIPEIFENLGEEAFRCEERRFIQRLSAAKNTVIATGGGMVLSPENWAALQAIGVLIHLHVPLNVALQRAKISQERPLLKGPSEEIRQLWLKRQEIYRQAAITIDTSQKNVEEIVREILDWLKGGN